jgi:hypothetical protein
MFVALVIFGNLKLFKKDVKLESPEEKQIFQTFLLIKSISILRDNQ